jgi:hypothetical protein
MAEGMNGVEDLTAERSRDIGARFGSCGVAVEVLCSTGDVDFLEVKRSGSRQEGENFIVRFLRSCQCLD